MLVLKAGEFCLGGLQAFSALLSSSLKEDSGELLAKNETLLYLPILGKKSSLTKGGGEGIEEITDINGFLGRPWLLSPAGSILIKMSRPILNPLSKLDRRT